MGPSFDRTSVRLSPEEMRRVRHLRSVAVRGGNMDSTGLLAILGEGRTLPPAGMTYRRNAIKREELPNVLRLIEDDHSNREIASMYSVDPSTIQRIRGKEKMQG